VSCGLSVILKAAAVSCGLSVILKAAAVSCGLKDLVTTETLRSAQGDVTAP
jgi:hypothetical protein